MVAVERYIEDIVRKNGFEIFYPEKHPLEAQLAIYLSVKEMVFSDGSGLTSLQLLGRNLGEIHVLRRWPAYDMCKNFLIRGSKSVTYYNVGNLVAGSIGGRQVVESGTTIPNKIDISRILSKITGKHCLVYSKKLSQNIEDDIKRYIASEMISARGRSEGYIQTVTNSLNSLGYCGV